MENKCCVAGCCSNYDGKLPRKLIIQEYEYTVFISNDTISVFNKITEKKCPVGNTFIKYDDHIVLRRQITNELHIPEVRPECIRTDHELHVKLIFTRFSGLFPQRFLFRYNCKLTKKSKPENFLPYLNQGEKFSCIFEELLQRQFRKNY